MRLFRRGEAASTLDLLVAGLGNPGREYAQDRHNAGWMVVDELARRHDGSFRSKFSGQLAELRVDEREARAAQAGDVHERVRRPGRSRRPLLQGRRRRRSLVVHDDVDLEPGPAAGRLGGGLAGHNGLRSIAQALGTQEFLRAPHRRRPPGSRRPPRRRRLRALPFEPEENGEALIAQAADAVEVLAAEGLAAAQRRFN